MVFSRPPIVPCFRSAAHGLGPHQFFVPLFLPVKASAQGSFSSRALVPLDRRGVAEGSVDSLCNKSAGFCKTGSLRVGALRPRCCCRS